MDNKNVSFSNIRFFSEGKNPPKNEDVIAYSDTILVLSDGATDKSGQVFEGRTGGEIAAELAVNVCLKSQKNGTELINEITSQLKELYEQINPNALEDSAYRFAATLVVARIVNDEVIITQVGDSSFRINGTDTYTNNKLVDYLTANTRKAYIEETGDVAGSRDFIMPLLKAQHRYQNNAELPLGYAVIDGTPVPEQFIKIHALPLNTVRSIELVSDGYYGVFPESISIEAYETLFKNIEEVDPDKYRQYVSTKTSDDRSVLIAEIN